MFLKRVRFLFAVVVLFAVVAGSLSVASPTHGAAEASDFTAASKVLTQTGEVGKWTVKEPPNFPAVPCRYPSGTNQMVGMPVTDVLVSPRAGLSSEVVQVTTAIKRRLPDGTLQSVATQPNSVIRTGTATAAAPYETIPPGLWMGIYGDLGSTLVQTITIQWGLSGRVELLLTKYQTTLEGPPDQTFAVTDACYPALAATGALSDTTVTVDQKVNFNYYRMPADPALGVGIYIDGVFKNNSGVTLTGNGSYYFPIKPAPMGKHTIKAYRYGRGVTKTFTIVPRIKVRPSTTHKRGELVDISLRGYAKYETVNIRWKKGTSWVQVGQVKTSGTGSANVYVKVPSWVPDGSTSVRGDGQYGHAQTNAVTVSGGSPLTSPTPAQTEAPTSTPLPATSTPEPNATSEPTDQPATPEPVASETATAQPTETAIPTGEPTEEPAATETPSVEPTVVPSETPEATATESSG
jgi:hypothetical protein